MLLMLKDDGNGGSSLQRDGGEGLWMDSKGLGAVARVCVYIYFARCDGASGAR